ncbi:hypothetical protein [Limosilactobacillus agrestimuris]|uniref:hypothetical protein n=1 Tax=Limosilactobacillus agrestimuris TaxID=2941331 RepID=UPI002040A1D6|nr:hypothetical protein [Limosilactobacillus agrestimuris]
MNQNVNPQKLIDDMQRWITATREDKVWTQHESLYLEVLAQWKAVNRYRPEHGTEEDQRLYQLYWTAMDQWHQSFSQQSEEIFDAMPIQATNKAGFYDGILQELQSSILERIPKIQQGKIVRMTSFLNILRVSLNDMTKLSLDDLSVVDMSLLLDYWKFLGDALREF